MKTTLFLIGLALTVPACRPGGAGQPAIVADVAQAPRLSGIDTASMDTSVRPGDDFFRYANGQWLDETRIPADRPSYGTLNELAGAAQSEVRQIIEASRSGAFPAGSDERNIADLYSSWMNLERRNAIGLAPIQPEFARIDAIEHRDDLARYFASALRRGLAAPFALSQFPDLRDPGYYALYVLQAGLGLPDREYYLDDSDKFAEIRRKYIDHVAKMLELAAIPRPRVRAGAIFALETRLAAGHSRKEAARDWSRRYDKVSSRDLGKIMPNFAWPAFLEELGAGKLDSLILGATAYLGALDEILVGTDIDTWRAYLKWSVLRSTSSRLTAEIDTVSFEFYGRVLAGTAARRPMWRRGVAVVNRTLGDAVGRIYVSTYVHPDAKARMAELVRNLLRTYEKRIRTVDWMSNATRAEALDKLAGLETGIAYPDSSRDYTGLDIDPRDLYGNLERAAVADFDRALARVGRAVDRSEWPVTPQTVNAYYRPASNEIIVPAAILKPPFFNRDADDAVNYGAIGAVIGHEIGHAFDDAGSRFDGSGRLRNWWSEDSRAAFEARTDRLVTQYSEFRPFDDLSVNGKYTLGENIGDLGGISIALEAYRLSLGDDGPPVIDGFTGVQRVFLGYAQAWRSKYREEALRLLIATNPHAPTMYRVNGAVRNVPEFYDAFRVTEGDSLYLPPGERVRIW